MNKKIENRMKKILFVTPDLIAGGAQRQLINMVNAFHEKRYEVSVFMFYDEGELRNFLDENVKIFFPPSVSIIRKFRALWIIHGTIKLFKVALAEKPDIIYSRQWPIIPIALVGKILKIKTVSVEINSLEHSLLVPKRRLLFLTRKLCARLSDKVVANSESLATEVEEVFGLESDVKVIYNGIDTANIRKKSQEKQEHKWFGTDTPLILAMGYFKKSDQKGFVYLLEALEIVNRTKTVRLIILGRGKRQNLESLSKKLSIKDKTDFISAVPNPFPYVSNADIFVCSSIYEGLSNVILEAMTLGKPVISTDHKHGANEIIENGKSGILVPIANPKSIAEAIEKILDNEELRKKLGEEAKKRSEYFSKDKMISRYQKLFDEM